MGCFQKEACRQKWDPLLHFYFPRVEEAGELMVVGEAWREETQVKAKVPGRDWAAALIPHVQTAFPVFRVFL